jgi:tetratricopeptide (TPR) repeat protein
MSLLLALLLQVGPDPTGGGMRGDDLVRDRPPRENARGPGTEQEITDPTSAWLQSCLDAIGTDAARAHTMAQIRRTQTTGTERVLANHCLGTAASELALWDDARSAFMAAHDETPEGEIRARARFTMMAGNAALAGGDSEGALALLTQAGAEARSAAAAPLQAIAAIDLARALVALNRQEEALGALDEATGFAPESAEGWLLKATLLRRMNLLDAAQTAIETAVKLAPGADGLGPEIGLEAGLIAVLAGRDEAARASWQSVIDLAADSPAAKQARDYLVQLGPAQSVPTNPKEPPA